MTISGRYAYFGKNHENNLTKLYANEFMTNNMHKKFDFKTV